MKNVTELVRFDWFIKFMFRDKSDFEILEGFLSELLKEDITILEILESESNQTRRGDKFNRVDIMIRNSKDERIIVEVQNNEEHDYLQRILFGASKTITDNMGSGKAYEFVKKVISISVVYFEVGQGEDYIYQGMTQFRGIHLNDELILNEVQQQLFNKLKPQDLFPEYYLIKAGDFDEEKIKNTLDEWVYFLKTGYVKDSFKAKGLDKAKQKLTVAKMSARKRAQYEQDIKHLRSEASFLRTQVVNERFRIKAEKEKQAEIALAVKNAKAEAAAEAEEAAKITAEKALEKTVIGFYKIGLSKEKIAEALNISVEIVTKIIENQ
ncbi:MAG: PD-(D/E)XK nuclease family transposase [Saprospiraceae bacterium]|nr:PD-(D/E)XK nuclease family transposase [Saprospiraceae bacterium]